MSESEPRRLIAYCRQSKGRDDETRETSLSLEAQEEEIRAWAQANGYQVETPIRDHDLVGDDPNRPGIAELEARTAPGVTFGVYKWDRLARNLVLQETIVRAVERRGGAVVSIREPSNKLTRAIYGAVNEDFKDALSDRLRSIKRTQAQRGVLICSLPPFGYRRANLIERATPDGGTRLKATGPVVPDEATAPIVQEIFARFLAGEAIYPITADLAARAVPRGRGGVWTQSIVTELLANPVYAGFVTHKGQIVAEGVHAALISRDDFAAAQERRARQARTRTISPNRLTSWAEGFVEHACGARMYLIPIQSGPGKDGTRTLYPNFICQSLGTFARCPTPPRMMSAPKLEQAARRCLTADLAAVRPLGDAIAHAHAQAGGRSAEHRRQQLATQRAAVERRRARARESWMAGFDALEVWQTEHERYLAAIAELDREDAALPSAPDPARYRAAADALDGIAAQIDQASDRTLRAIIETLGTIVMGAEGVWIRYDPIFAAFFPAPHAIKPALRPRL